MVGSVIMDYLGGLHFSWPKITGRMYPFAAFFFLYSGMSVALELAISVKEIEGVGGVVDEVDAILNRH